MPTSAPPWHAMSHDEVLSRLTTDATRGLEVAEVERRRREHGPNALSDERGRPLWRVFVGQFTNLIVGLLLVAAGVAFALGDWIEGLAVLTIILLNAAIGFFTEWRASQALSALRKQAVPTAQVVRAGEKLQVPAVQLVPGDVVLLDAGVRVPADGRIVEAVQLRTGEAALTGESVPVAKTVEPVTDADAPVGDRVSMAFLGTGVTDGRGRMVVTATGMTTEVGKIGALVQGVEAQKTPLERKLDRLGKTLLWAVLGLWSPPANFRMPSAP